MYGFNTYKTVRGGKRATVATARKLLKTLCSALKNRRPYSDPEFDHEVPVASRNSARRLRKLQQYGYLPDAQAAPIASSALA